MSNVFWIQGIPPATLAIVMRPLGDDRMEACLLEMKRNGVQTVVSLLEEKEAVWLGLEDEGPYAEQLGMQFLSFPMPDVHTPPDRELFSDFVEGLADRLRAGEQIGIHCRGSIGRSTVTAACTLMHLGWKPKVALKAIEAARGMDVPDTQEQKEWILRYKVKH